MVWLDSSCTLACTFVLTPIFSGKPCVIIEIRLDFFFCVKGVMVLNRFQKYVKVIERSKGPSTILKTQLSLACYKIPRGLREPCSI